MNRHVAIGIALLLPIGLALAQTNAGGLPAITSTPTAGGGTTYSLTIQTLLLMTALSFIPAIVLMMTGFTRIVIVLSLLRHAMGMQTAPPNQVIVGDVKHSRVARSDLHALRALGCGEIRVCGPAALLPEDGTLDGCVVSHDFDAAIEGVDAAMMLRLQRERMAEGLVASLEDYHRDFGLDAARLRRAAPEAIVMHPGPMNRGIEITDEVADGPQSRVLRQVANGVAVRMAVLEALLG